MCRVVVVDDVDVDDPGPRCRLQARMSLVNENKVWRVDRGKGWSFGFTRGISMVGGVDNSCNKRLTTVTTVRIIEKFNV